MAINRYSALIAALLLSSVTACQSEQKYHAPQTDTTDVLTMSKAAPEITKNRNYCDWAFNLTLTERSEAETNLTELKVAFDESKHTISTNEGRSQFTTIGGAALALSSTNFEQCMDDFSWAAKFVEETYEKDLEETKRSTSLPTSLDLEVKAVQSELREHYILDVSGRNLYQKIFQTPDRSEAAKGWAATLVGYRLVESDEHASDYLENLLNEIEWVDATTFGQEASSWAFLIAQHADRNTDLQVLALERMTPFVDIGEVDKPDYAYLTDRVAINQGREQVYGSQTTGKCKDGLLIPEPIENVETVDIRRASMELDTLNEYLSAISAFSCRSLD